MPGPELKGGQDSGHRAQITDLAIHPGTAACLTASLDGSCRLWHTNGGIINQVDWGDVFCAVSLWLLFLLTSPPSYFVATQTAVFKCRPSGGASPWVTCCCWHSNGTHFYQGDQYGRCVYIFSLPCQHASPAPVAHLRVHPCGNSIFEWDIRNGKSPTRERHFKPPAGKITKLAQLGAKTLACGTAGEAEGKRGRTWGRLPYASSSVPCVAHVFLCPPADGLHLLALDEGWTRRPAYVSAPVCPQLCRCVCRAFALALAVLIDARLPFSVQHN